MTRKEAAALTRVTTPFAGPETSEKFSGSSSGSNPVSMIGCTICSIAVTLWSNATGALLKVGETVGVTVGLVDVGDDVEGADVGLPVLVEVEVDAVDVVVNVGVVVEHSSIWCAAPQGQEKARSATTMGALATETRKKSTKLEIRKKRKR